MHVLFKASRPQKWLALAIWHDKFPATDVENLALGTAIIGRDLGGISEQLGQGCGLLVPPGDPDALRAAMRLLIDDPAMRHRLEHAAFQRAHTHYAPQRHYERLMDVFAAVRAASAGGRLAPSPIS